jgi:hypothetical protein
MTPIKTWREIALANQKVFRSVVVTFDDKHFIDNDDAELVVFDSERAIPPECIADLLLATRRGSAIALGRNEMIPSAAMYQSAAGPIVAILADDLDVLVQHARRSGEES